MFSFFAFVALLATLASAVVNDFGPPQEFSIDARALRRQLKPSSAEGSDPYTFPHVHELLTALKSGQRRFEATSQFNHDDARAWKLENYEDTLDKAYYTAVAKYTLHDGVEYVSVGGKEDFSSRILEGQLEHCTSTRELNAFVDKPERFILVGTDAVGGSLLFSHRVLAVQHVSSDAGFCSRLTMEEVHPWELFQNINMQTLLERPFDTSFSGSREGVEEENSHRELQFAQPDPPLQSCSNPYYDDVGDGSGGWSFVAGEVVKVDKNKACAIFQKDVPGSFAANFNQGTRRAASTPTFGPVQCDNCFVVAGAGVLAVLNADITWKWKVIPKITAKAQLKLQGTAGASLSLIAKGGTFSSEKTFQLANAAGAAMVVPVFSGVALAFQFDGASLKFAGSATFEGSFSVAYGKLGSASLGMMYDSGVRFTKALQWQDLSKPFTNNGFRLSNFALSTEVMGKINVQLRLGGAVSVNFYAFVGATLTLSSPQGQSGKLSALKVRSAGRRELAAVGSVGTDVPAALSFSPGDKLSFSHAYSHFQPNETIIFYYSLKSPSTGLEYPITSRSARISGGGQDTVNGEWVLPWNLDFSKLGQTLDTTFGDGMFDLPDSLKAPGTLEALREHPADAAAAATAPTGQFVMQVRSNILLDHAIATSEPFEFNMFTGAEDDGIFSAPAAGASFPVSQPLSVRWDASLLRRFEPGMHSWTGREMLTTHVEIELVCERLSTDPSATTGLVEESLRMSLGQYFPNTGEAQVSLFPQVADDFDRFYLVVSDAALTQVQGWSKGYFYLNRDGSDGSKRALVSSSSSSVDESASKRAAHRRTSQRKTSDLAIDPRLVAAQEQMTLFGGRHERAEPLYRALSDDEVLDSAAAFMVSARAGGEADWWKKILAQSEHSSVSAKDSRSLSRSLLFGLGKKKKATGLSGFASAAKNALTAGCNPPPAGGPLQMPWSLSIFAGAGFQGVKFAIGPISKTFNIDKSARAVLVTLKGSVKLPAILPQKKGPGGKVAAPKLPKGLKCPKDKKTKPKAVKKKAKGKSKRKVAKKAKRKSKRKIAKKAKRKSKRKVAKKAKRKGKRGSRRPAKKSRSTKRRPKSLKRSPKTSKRRPKSLKRSPKTSKRRPKSLKRSPKTKAPVRSSRSSSNDDSQTQVQSQEREMQSSSSAVSATDDGTGSAGSNGIPAWASRGIVNPEKGLPAGMAITGSFDVPCAQKCPSVPRRCNVDRGDACGIGCYCRNDPTVSPTPAPTPSRLLVPSTMKPIGYPTMLPYTASSPAATSATGSNRVAPPSSAPSARPRRQPSRAPSARPRSSASPSAVPTLRPSTQPPSAWVPPTLSPTVAASAGANSQSSSSSTTASVTSSTTVGIAVGCVVLVVVLAALCFFSQRGKAGSDTMTNKLLNRLAARSKEGFADTRDSASVDSTEIYQPRLSHSRPSFNPAHRFSMQQQQQQQQHRPSLARSPPPPHMGFAPYLAPDDPRRSSVSGRGPPVLHRPSLGPAQYGRSPSIHRPHGEDL